MIPATYSVKFAVPRRAAAKQASTHLACPRGIIPNKGVSKVYTVVTLPGSGSICKQKTVCALPLRPPLPAEHERLPDSSYFSLLLPELSRNLTGCYNAFGHGWSTTAFRPACPRSRGIFSPYDAQLKQSVAQEVSVPRVRSPGYTQPHANFDARLVGTQ